MYKSCVNSFFVECEDIRNLLLDLGTFSVLLVLKRVFVETLLGNIYLSTVLYHCCRYIALCAYIASNGNAARLRQRHSPHRLYASLLLMCLHSMLSSHFIANHNPCLVCSLLRMVVDRYQQFVA